MRFAIYSSARLLLTAMPLDTPHSICEAAVQLPVTSSTRQFCRNCNEANPRNRLVSELV